MKVSCPVDSKTVERSRPRWNGSGEITITFRCKRVRRSLRITFRTALQNNLELFCFRRPNPKMGQFLSDQLRADRKTAMEFGLPHLIASTSGTLAVVPEFSFCF